MLLLFQVLLPALVSAVLLVGWAASGPALAAETPARTSQSPPAAAAPQAAGDYVGEDTCLTCHDTQTYKGTRHALTSNPRTPAANHGCESCHGPGSAHVEAGGGAVGIVNLAKLRPQQASEICATCHNRAVHALFEGSQHDQRNVGCVTCHSVHTPVGDKQIKANTQLQLCGTCHRQIVNKQYRFNHMPVREGKLQCTSCHNPHGSTNVKLLKAGTTVDESCTSCHSEKRGPYLWEHAPVAEACVTCHDPHGSNNERLLVSKVPFLCQRCHVTSRHPPTVYEAFTLQNSQNANKIFGRGCVQCHQQIHGSNSPSGRAFLR
jgi:DmsE family decaheme c-type cytochrome